MGTLFSTRKNYTIENDLTNKTGNNYASFSEAENLEIRKSKVHGSGLFASSRIEAGTAILNLPGEKLSLQSYITRFPQFDGEWHCRRGGENSIVYRENKTLFSNVNHSRNPNLHIEYCHGQEDRLVTTKPICKGKELLLDYRLYVPDEYISISKWI